MGNYEMSPMLSAFHHYTISSLWLWH